MYFVEKTDEFKYFKNFDYILFFSVIILTIGGMIVLGSATKTNAAGIDDLRSQIISMILGIILALSISVFDYREIKNLSFPFYAFTIILLVIALFIGKGRDEWGTAGWIIIKGWSFQPSELAKTATILILARYMERMKKNEGKYNLIYIAIFALIPLILVLIQPDVGTALVFVFIFLILIYIADIKYSYIFMAITGFIVAIPLAWFFIFSTYQKNRIMTFIYPELDPLGAGYQVQRAKLAIGSGKLFGQGLFNGIQTQSNGIPVKESDFIFAVIGEELGFIGALLFIAFLLFIVLRCLYVARKTKDLYGTYIVIGVAAMWAIHIIENIGMNVGMMPVTGIPLPFISAGGSAMITNYIALGIVLNVSMRN